MADVGLDAATDQHGSMTAIGQKQNAKGPGLARILPSVKGGLPFLSLP